MIRRTSGSLQLLQVFGIPVRVHFTFLFLVLWLGLYAASLGQSPAAALLLLALVFVSVVLHELGHALTARLFGIETREILLYPLGGFARLARAPSGLAELVIAAAGPLVNLVLCVFLWGWALALGLPFDLGELSGSRLLLLQLTIANGLLFAVNLLPAFPMDGGRILRATLSMFVPEDTATRVAATLAQGLAVLLGLVAVFGPFKSLALLVVALFVFLAAGQEASFNRTRTVLRGRLVTEAMMTEFEVLAPQDSLELATRIYLASHQRDFPVVDAWGRVQGLLHRTALLSGLAHLGPEGAVLDAMDRSVEPVQPETPVLDVLRRFQGEPGKPVLVEDDDGLRGIVTFERVMQLVEVVQRLALRTPR